MFIIRHRTEKHSSYYHVSRALPTSSAGPAPVASPPAPTQDFTDQEDDIKKPQPIYDQPEKITLQKEVSWWCIYTLHVITWVDSHTTELTYQWRIQEPPFLPNSLV